MTDYQRILVVGTQAQDADVARVRARLGARTIVLTAPTTDGARVVRALELTGTPEVELAPVRFPDVDRGHRLDELVRRYALADRFRDVVVVADPATLTLLLRVLAPDQLPESGAVTEVGLPRAGRPVPVGRAVAGGVALAVLSGLLSALLPVWVTLGVALAVALVLVSVRPRRHLGYAVLISLGVAVAVLVLSIAGSSRFPGSW